MSKFLFDFVHDLSMREKAYFKRYVSIYDEDANKNYLKLYAAIEKMKIYDKAKLVEQFKGTSIDKYFSSEINYLKNKLLSSLINFHSNNSPRNKVQKGIFFIQVLIVKGFRKEALKKLKFYKKIAYQQEEFSSILKLIELEEDIHFKEGIIGFRNVLNVLKEERNAITAKIQNLNDLRLLREEIRELQFTERFITNDFINQKNFYENPILKSDTRCLSIKATGHWYYIHALKNFLKRDYPAALKVSKDYVLFLEKYKYLFPASKSLPVISNYLYFAALLGNKKAFDLSREKLIQLSRQPNVDMTYINYILNARDLEFAYKVDDLELMEQGLEKSLELINKKRNKMGAVQVSYLLILIVRSTICLKKYDLGAAQINDLYQALPLEYLAIQSRLFSLIIHYTLGWKQLVESEIVLLRKMKKDFPRDKNIIDAFYTFFKSELLHPESKQKNIIKLQKKLKTISNDVEGNFVFEDFDFYKWSLGLAESELV